MIKILVIDDSETNYLLIKSVFEDEAGIEVRYESNSELAYDTILNYRPQIILLDLIMPEVNGFQILRQVKANPSVSSIPIIVLSSKSDDKSMQMVMDLKATGFIKKPLDLELVYESVKKLIHPE